ncbi:DUF4330 domain-containing protein [Acetivibrio cellulolyticus]|uniref:DUF4330 domain-containing protein n=1 Tax=Acetivibrio cellulolyticus TaxID=35830 RepID=UPI0001E2D196|nr:DUF4330 domain-containing protein [Acetivibrio cellulolyticus]
MIIDSKGKLFGKVSIIDILIVLVVVAAVVGVGYKLTKSNTISFKPNEEKFLLTFYADEAPDYSVKAAKVGDIVKDFENGSTFGKVIEAPKIDKAISFHEFHNGEWIVGSKTGYCSYYMKVEGTGVTNTDGGYSFTGANYYIGRTVTMRVGNAVFSGRIYNIEKE